MKDGRFRVPVEASYVHAVGLATISFARLEWDAVHCCERMQPGYLRTVDRKTAGMIASDLVNLAASHPDPGTAISLGAAAAEFVRLVRRRNDLLHASPGTAPTGEQRLFRRGDEWTTVAIDEVADEFVAAATVLNHYHHSLLRRSSGAASDPEPPGGSTPS